MAQQQPAAAAAAAPSPPRSFYRRELPPACVAFSSAAGRALFAEALAAGGAESYWRLSECFHTQSEPAFCGLGALAMVLNALAVDPGRVWKGAWRWFDESMLDCCVPLPQVARDGIVLDALACLARCNGAAVLARRAPPEEEEEAQAAEQAQALPDAEAAAPAREGGGAAAAAPAGTSAAAAALPQCTYDEFLSDLRASCFAPVQGGCGSSPHAGAPSHLIVSYSRAALGQSGGGHFSPVGALAPTSGMALIMDVARFKYPPHWVPLSALWAAMRRRDPATRLPRGYLRLSAAAVAGASPVGAFITLSRRRSSSCCCAGGAADAADAWLDFLTGGGESGGALRAALAAAPGDAEDADADAALRAAAVRVRQEVARLPPLAAAVERYEPLAPCGGAAAAAVLAAVRSGALHAALLDAFASSSTSDAPLPTPPLHAWEVDALALLLLAAPADAWAGAAPGVLSRAWLPPGPGADEVAHLRAQLAALTCCDVAACDAQGGRCCPPPAAAAAAAAAAAGVGDDGASAVVPRGGCGDSSCRAAAPP
jgi:glutathione gamma-glutamylcysteinyltransferase